jgi:hypothetical protein
MSRVSLYRNSAQDCMSRARDAKSPDDRARWLARAQLWLQKAQDVERDKGAERDNEAERSNGQEQRDKSE